MIDLPRTWKNGAMIIFDIIAVSTALWLAYCLRFNHWTFPSTRDQWGGVAAAPLVSIPIFAWIGLYRMVIRYLSDRALWRLMQATTYAAIGLVVVAFATAAVNRGVVPRTVPLLFWALASIFIISSRFIAKSLLGPAPMQFQLRRRIVVYGAGAAGAQLVASIRAQRAHMVVAFIDENSVLWGHDVAGITVFPPSQLKQLIEHGKIDEIILCTPSIGLGRRREILTLVGTHAIKVRMLPPLIDVVAGKYLVSNIPEIDIDELLGRSSVPPDASLLKDMIDGRTIMVTGAGGSIGSELCRLIVAGKPQRLILFEANEHALYQIDRELAALSDLAIIPVLASVGDAIRVRSVIAENRVEVIFHAAAHKHVPLVEANALEGIRNNVLGTMTLADAALKGGVRNFVLISSDKAVRPTNVMGATKRWAELIVRQKAAAAAQMGSGQHFCCVRFGNVLGSNGSVVPLFKEQIARGGPVTLTDAQMTRYFMSIHEAAELIVQAGTLSTGGDIFLLDMGEPILIRDLAENMIRLAGFEVRDDNNAEGDIEISVVGSRPGEKMYEELFYDQSTATGTKHPKILRATDAPVNTGELDGAFSKLSALIAEEDEAAARELLFRFIR